MKTNIFQQKNPNYLLVQGIFLNTVMLVLFLILYQKLPPQIPLFYSRAEGDSQLVDTVYVLLIPFLSFVITMLNYYLIKFYFNNDPPVRNLLFITANTINIVLLFTFIKILFLVI